MRRSFLAFFLLMAVVLSAAWLSAAESPVSVTHKMTGQNSQGNIIAVDLSVQVTNTGPTALSNLTLTFVPRPPFLAQRTSQTIPTLAPGQSASFALQLQVPATMRQRELPPRALSWAGSYDGSQGKVEFPVTSRPGGG